MKEQATFTITNVNTFGLQRELKEIMQRYRIITIVQTITKVSATSEQLSDYLIIAEEK